MPKKTGICDESDVRELLSRTDTYFSKVGLLPVLLPLPVQGDCGALKRGILRSCLLCSDTIHSQLCQVLSGGQRSEKGTPGGCPVSEGAALDAPLPSVSPTAASAHQFTRSSRERPSTPPAEESCTPSLDPVERDLLPLKVLTEKLRIFAAELDDEELKQTAGDPILSREVLGLADLQKVVDCLDSNQTEGVLLLLCERRSDSVPVGPYRASLDILQNATEAQRAERQELQQQEQSRQPQIQDLGLGAVAGGLVTVAATGQRQLMSLFCIEELPDDGRHQLVRVLAVRVMALAFLWPSVFCKSSFYSDDDLRTPGPLLRHFPKPAKNFLCFPSGLQLSRHFDTYQRVDFTHADQVRGCACVKRMQRKVQQQTVRDKKDSNGHQADSSPRDASSRGSPSPVSGGPEGPSPEWHEFWAVSKRRFYTTWAQRGSQLVPDNPANSLIEAVGQRALSCRTDEEHTLFHATGRQRFYTQRAFRVHVCLCCPQFDSPLKFPHEETDQKSPTALSLIRRRGGPRGKRARSAQPPSTDSTPCEMSTDLGGSCTRNRGKNKVAQSRQQQAFSADTPISTAADANWIDPSRPFPAPGSYDCSNSIVNVIKEEPHSPT